MALYVRVPQVQIYSVQGRINTVFVYKYWVVYTSVERVRVLVLVVNVKCQYSTRTCIVNTSKPTVYSVQLYSRYLGYNVLQYV